MKHRLAVLILLALSVAGATHAWLREDMPASTEPAGATTKPDAVAPERPVEGPLFALDDELPPMQANPFAVRTWEPPKPKTVSAPPPPPQAPPLPFRFIGKIKGDETTFMLLHGQRLLDVREGDEIDGIYVIETYRNGQLDFVYRPLQIKQSLFVGTEP
jgi:hypothetical protein